MGLTNKRMFGNSMGTSRFNLFSDFNFQSFFRNCVRIKFECWSIFIDVRVSVNSVQCHPFIFRACNGSKRMVEKSRNYTCLKKCRIAFVLFWIVSVFIFIDFMWGISGGSYIEKKGLAVAWFYFHWDEAVQYHFETKLYP